MNCIWAWIREYRSSVSLQIHKKQISSVSGRGLRPHNNNQCIYIICAAHDRANGIEEKRKKKVATTASAAAAARSQNCLFFFSFYFSVGYNKKFFGLTSSTCKIRMLNPNNRSYCIVSFISPFSFIRHFDFPIIKSQKKWMHTK